MDYPYLLDMAQPTPSLALIHELNSSFHHLAKGPGSNWTYCYQGDAGPEQMFFDENGNVITPQEAQATILDEGVTRLFWNSQQPELLGSNYNKLYSQSSGEYTDPPVELYATTDNDGNLIVEKDIAGIKYLKPFARGNLWVGYDDINELAFKINTLTDTKEVRFSVEKGTGPYMGDILAIDSTTEGDLFVLSTLYSKQSIYQINPWSGNRTLVIKDLPKVVSPYLLVNDNGHFFLNKKACVTQPDETSLCGPTIYEIIPTQDPTDYQFNEVGFEASNTLVEDMAWDNNGNINLLYNQRDSQFVSKLEGTSLTPSLSPITFSDYTLDPGATYPSVEQPALIAVGSGVENSRFIKMYFDFQYDYSIQPIKYTLTAPGGSVYTGNFVRTSVDQSSYMEGFAWASIKVDTSPAPGNWTLSLTDIFDQNLEITETTGISLTFHQAHHARQMAFTSPTSLTTYNAYTPSLTNIDLETGFFETVALTAPNADAAYPVDFKMASDGVFYLSTQTDCNIYQISPSGEASLFATRPDSYPINVTGKYESSNSPTIAFGPAIDLGPISTTGRVWWLFQ